MSKVKKKELERKNEQWFLGFGVEESLILSDLAILTKNDSSDKSDACKLQSGAQEGKKSTVRFS